MSTATISDRLRKLAGRSMLQRAPMKQAATAEPAAKPERPEPDAVAEARTTLEGFAGRLREFSIARTDMDAAADAERNAGKLDFASLIERGEPMPDLTELTSRRASAEVRTRACKQLLDRMAEPAHNAMHTLRRDALANARAGLAKVRGAVLDALPAGLFSPESHEAITRQAEPVRFALRRLEAVECFTWPSVAVPAELFGMRVRYTRTEILPVNPESRPRDMLAPDKLAREIDKALAVHLETVRFILDATADPLAVKV